MSEAPTPLVLALVNEVEQNYLNASARGLVHPPLDYAHAWRLAREIKRLTERAETAERKERIKGAEAAELIKQLRIAKAALMLAGKEFGEDSSIIKHNDAVSAAERIDRAMERLDIPGLAQSHLAQVEALKAAAEEALRALRTNTSPQHVREALEQALRPTPTPEKDTTP